METRPITAIASNNEKMAKGKNQVAPTKRCGSAILTQEELDKLASYDSKGKHHELEDVRNIFLFMAHTGLRYSEVCQLTPTDIHEDTIDLYYQMHPHATKVKLNGASRSILDHYKGEIFSNGKALPCMSQQKFNYLLKLLCKLMCIDKPVSTESSVENRIASESKPKFEFITSYSARLTYLHNYNK